MRTMENSPKDNLVYFADYIHNPLSSPSVTKEGIKGIPRRFCYISSQIDIKKAEDMVERALALRDNLLRATLLDGLGYKCIKNGKNGVYLDQFYRLGDARRLRTNCKKHFGRQVFMDGIRGRICSRVLRHRLEKDGSAKFWIGNTWYTATDMADILYVSACKASKYLEIARITDQIREYRLTYGKQNTSFQVGFKEAVHYGNSTYEKTVYQQVTILMSHSVFFQDAIIPEYSEPVTLALPEEISRKAEKEDVVDLSIYDGNFEDFTVENTELLNNIEKELSI